MNIRTFSLAGFATLLLCLVSGCGDSSSEKNKPAEVSFPGSDLANLPVLADEQSRAITAENPNGAKGQAAREAPNTNEASPAAAARAADELGQGWKVRPFMRVNAGQTVTLMDVDGPGVIRHIFMSEGLSRAHVLRIYWDGETTPSVEVPAPDFFAVGHEMFAPVNSQVVIDNPANALNCYWPMPFKRHVWMTFANESHDDLGALAFQIDYALKPVTDQTGYFHAQWRRASTATKNPYVILDGVRGRGRYVGTFLAWTQQRKGWFGEGQVKFYLDGDTQFPTICGTGLEDYFGCTWGFLGPVSTEFCGTTLPSQDTNAPPNYWSLYRWHIPDPISFSHDIKVTVPALGWGNATYAKLSDDIASVAYWYQTEPHAPFPALPPVERRGRLKSTNQTALQPPADYLLDPHKAVVTDSHSNIFSWHAAGEDNVGGDHYVYGGWEAIGDYRDYVAYGKALVERKMREGLIAEVRPVGNRLRAEWPFHASLGEKLFFSCSLTDGAARKSGNGTAVRVELSGSVLFSEQLTPGNPGMIQVSKRLTGAENKITIELENLGGEDSSVYLDARSQR